MRARPTRRRSRSVARRWMLALVVSLVGVDCSGAARASSEAPSTTRTAPYDDDGVFTASNSACRTACRISGTADKTTGDLAASVHIEPPIHEQLSPGLRKYWYGKSSTAIKATTIAAGPGTTRWTARLDVSSAKADAAASSGSAYAELIVGFGLTDATQPSEPFVQGTSVYMNSATYTDTISNGELVLQFELSLPSAGVYNAYVVTHAAARVTNSSIVSAPPVSLPCLIGVPFGRGLTVCVPPDVPSQSAHGTAEGRATGSIAARVNSVTVST